LSAGVIILAVTKIGTGICKNCGRFQYDKKFKKSDMIDNAATNFVICDKCKRSLRNVSGVPSRKSLAKK